MKKRIALLMAFLLLALTLGAHASPAGSDAVGRVTQVHLNAVQAQVLPVMENALRARADKVELSGYHITLTELIDVLNELNRDPEFFYYEYAMPFYDVGTQEVSEVELYYREAYGEAELAAFQRAVQEALAALVPGMSDLQKALTLHDYLALHIAYDDDAALTGTGEEDAYSAYGALVNGKAVCQGYAGAYQLLLGRCGIDAVTVASTAMNHGWNLVKLDGSWYHADVTWDDPLPDTLGRAGHSFFLLSDGAIRSRDPGSGDLHFGWDGEIACTDTRFDEAPLWAETQLPLVFTDASTVWLLRSQGRGMLHTLTLVRRDWTNGEETEIYQIKDCWPVWGEDACWLGAYSGFCLWNGWLFFNDSLHIYGYDPAEGSLHTVLAYEGGDGCIYGIAAGEDGLRYRISRAPDEAGSIRSIVPEGPSAAVPVPEPEPLPALPFADVSPSDYFCDAVRWAYDNNVTTGVSAAEFAPMDACTRGQVITFLWRAAGCPAPAGAKNPFADVPENAYYRDAVLWAVEQKITDGTGLDAATGKPVFSPDAVCSYAHILTFLWRAETGSVTSREGAWYGEALQWAQENALLSGTRLEAEAECISDDCPRCDVVTYLWRCR